MTTDPMVRDSKRRMRATTLGRLQTLQTEQTRWRRKLTIATNKLNAVQSEIEGLAELLAREKLPTEWEGK